MTLENKDITIYLAQQKLAEWTDIIVSASVKTSRIYQNKAERLRYYLKAMQYEQFLSDEEIVTILTCIEKIAEITDWPTAPTLIEQTQPSIIIGQPGPAGANGLPGIDGTDANIDVIQDPTYDNIAITETVVAGVKTFSIGYAPYFQPTISLNLTTSAFPNPNSTIQEKGQVVASVPVTVTLDKGREDVVSSALTNPSALDASYQLQLNLIALNGGTQQVIGISDTNVSANTTYSANIIDDRSTINASKTLTFVIPFLYGGSTSLLIQTTYYNNLARIIQAQGNKAVVFNGTDSYFYLAYDASYPDLKSILDGNGFEAIGAFTKTTENINMLSGTESMKVYRTTSKTDIPSQTYTFKF